MAVGPYGHEWNAHAVDAVEGEVMGLTMADVLRRHQARMSASLDSMEGALPPVSSISYEIFNHKMCVACGAPCDLKRYFGKRKYAYPYCKKCKAAYMREWRKTNKMTPEQKCKDNCRSYANQYLRRGKIKREPCKACGEPKSQMHHHDYSKPLDVEWLCRPCHLKEHYGPVEINLPQC